MTEAGTMGMKQSPDYEEFIPSPDALITVKLDLARIKEDELVCDLGCGDGRVLVRAARDYGARGVGCEIRPGLVAEARDRIRNLGLESRISLQHGDFDSVDLRQVFFKQIALVGSTMGRKGDLFEVLPLVEAGRMRPVLDRVYPLEEAAAAHERLEQGRQFGKIVLSVD